MVNAHNNQLTSLHGTALEIYNCGIVLIGDSQIGKTELALTLINRGHKFISDDMVCLEDNGNHLSLIANSSFMHLRGIGLIDIKNTYGASSLSNKVDLELIIELTKSETFPTDPLFQLYTNEKIANYMVDKFQLFISPNRPLADLVEIIVKYHQGCKKGYNSHIDFIKDQDSKLCN